MKGISLPLLLAIVAAAAKARAATDPQAEACECPGCKFRKASDALLAARKAYVAAEAKATKARNDARTAVLEQDDAQEALCAAQAAFDIAADALNAEDAKAEGGAQ